MADPTLVVAQVSVPFSETASDLTLSLEFSADPTLAQSLQGWIAMRLFPNVTGVTAVASAGRVEYTGQVGQQGRNEFVTVQNSDSFSANYPIDGGNVAVQVMFAYDGLGNSIPTGSLSFSATDLSSEIKSNIPFTGAVRLVYITSYRVYRYQPTGGVSHNASGTLLYRNYGTVLMFKGEISVVLDTVGQGFTEKDEQRNKELYRVVSTLQSNESGTWEKHPTFDAGGAWADAGAPQKDDGIARTEFQRVHEIGYVVSGTTSQIAYHNVDAPLEQGTNAGLPVLSYNETAGSSFDSTIWMDTYNNIDKIVTKAAAQKRFPNQTFA